MESPPRHELLLSPPSISVADMDAVSRALERGWAAPAGPDLTRFEAAVSAVLGVAHAVALSSGTAALHLGLKYLGVGADDAVIVPTFTFAAPAFAACYLGATPILVDVEPETWTIDVGLAAQAIAECQGRGQRIAAIVPVDVYGNTAHYESLLALADAEGIPVLEDAAESLGSRHGVAAAGSFGSGAALSFNGNKVMTTAGGGMLVTGDAEMADKVRYWSRQSRSDDDWYEHDEIGFNLGLSNILAALGNSQLARLTDLVRRRRQVRDWYQEHLDEIPGLTVLGDAPWCTGNAWLTVIRCDRRQHGAARDFVRMALNATGIESRPTFKPLHQQRVFERSPSVLTGTADEVFAEAICLPSGSDLQEGDVARVAATVRQALLDYD